MMHDYFNNKTNFDYQRTELNSRFESIKEGFEISQVPALIDEI